MLFLKCLAFVTFLAMTLVSAPGSVRAQGKEPRPLSEAEILQLSNLLGKAEALLARLEKAGVEKSVDRAALERLKKAGVSNTVLAAIRRTLQPAVAAPKLLTLKGEITQVTCMAFSPDGSTVALGGNSTQVELWEVAAGKRRATLPDHPDSVYSLAFSPDGKTLAVGSKQNVVLWDVVSGEKGHTFRGLPAEVNHVRFLSATTLIALSQATVRSWDVTTTREKTRLTLDHKLTLSPDGTVLAEVGLSVFNHACRFNLWDIAEGKKRTAVPEQRFECLAFSPDSRSFAAASGKQVNLFDVASVEKRPGHGLHTASLHSLAIAPDGKTLASGGTDRTVILWDIMRQEPRLAWDGHKGSVFVRFSPDGTLLASGSAADDTVKLWDVATGKERGALQGHKGGITVLGFSADGKRAATASKDGTVKLWDLSPVAGAAK
jgi:WD40 repeat protein